MRLYHGTSAKYLNEILTSGLKPRGLNPSNWAAAPSNSEAIYLTNAYAVYFAEAASNADDTDLLVVEVETSRLNKLLFAPDEDFLEQASRSKGDFPEAGKNMLARTEWFRKRAMFMFQHHWQDSLKHLGTCAYYGRIPKSAITRIAVIPKNNLSVRAASDPTISLLNYMVMGSYYRNLIAKVFGAKRRKEKDIWSNSPYSQNINKLKTDDIKIIKV